MLDRLLRLFDGPQSGAVSRTALVAGLMMSKVVHIDPLAKKEELNSLHQLLTYNVAHQPTVFDVSRSVSSAPIETRTIQRPSSIAGVT